MGRRVLVILAAETDSSSQSVQATRCSMAMKENKLLLISLARLNRLC
jgi:hypothetical protein